MPRYLIKAKTRQRLLNLATPDSAGQPEALPWVLYDTQTFVNASTTQLQFFQTVQSDKTLGNMEGAGALPDPQFFEIWYITVDFLFPAVTTNAGVAGDMNDLLIFENAGRATIEISMSNKVTGPWPVRSAHASGGPIGTIASAVVTNTQNYSNNGPQDGGLWIGGQIVLPPKVNFAVTLRLAAVQTLNTNNLPICVGLHGVLHRRVL